MQESKHQTLVTYLKIHSQSKQLKTDIHKYLHSGRRETCNSVRYGVGAVDDGLVVARRGPCGGGDGGGRRARANGTCGAGLRRRHNTRHSWARRRRRAAATWRGTRTPTDAPPAPARPARRRHRHRRPTHPPARTPLILIVGHLWRSRSSYLHVNSFLNGKSSSDLHI